MAADIAADVVRTQLALDQLHRRKNGSLWASGAKRWRPGVYLPVDHLQGCGGRGTWPHSCWQPLTIHLCRRITLDKFQYPAKNCGGRVLAGHREHVLAVDFSLQIPFAKNSVKILLQEIGLALLDHQYSALIGAKLSDFFVNQGISYV